MKKTIIIILAALVLIAAGFLFYGFADNSTMPHLNDNEEEVIDGNNLDNKAEKDSQNDSGINKNDTENSESEEVDSDDSQEDENSNESETNDKSDYDAYDDSEEQTEE